MNEGRRAWLRQAASVCVSAPAWAGAATDAVRLVVNEGATSQVSIVELQERYRSFAGAMARVLGRPNATVTAFLDVRRFQEQVDRSRPDWIFGKTVDVLARLVDDALYVPVVKAAEPYVAGFIAAPGSSVRELRDLQGLDVLLPPRDVMTTRLALTELEQAGLAVKEVDARAIRSDVRGKVAVRYLSSHEAVAEAVGRGWWFSAGAVNPTVLGRWKRGEWVAGGGAVLHEMQPQPNWSLIARADLPPEEIAKVQAMAVALSGTPEGRRLLKDAHLPAFVVAHVREYKRLVNFLR